MPAAPRATPSESPSPGVLRASIVDRRAIAQRIRPASYLVAGAALAAAVALWPRSDGVILGGVCVVMATAAAATGFVLLAPLAPRATWGLAAIAPALAALLAVLAVLAAR